MKEVHYEPWHPTQRSPCIDCENEHLSKSECCIGCKRLAAYQEFAKEANIEGFDLSEEYDFIPQYGRKMRKPEAL